MEIEYQSGSLKKVSGKFEREKKKTPKEMVSNAQEDIENAVLP